MKSIEIHTNPAVEEVFSNYPNRAHEKITYLRTLIIDVANKTEGITRLEETLKWGEPSYLVKNGSTLRIDWKKSKPNQYAMFFSCSSKLVPTFRIIFKDVFNFEGNRAIIFPMDKDLQEDELKKCIAVSLTYHKVKQLPFLGL